MKLAETIGGIVLVIVVSWVVMVVLTLAGVLRRAWRRRAHHKNT
jgi:threonine/homoserine/homoserine lactone efflux protein